MDPSRRASRTVAAVILTAASLLVAPIGTGATEPPRPAIGPGVSPSAQPAREAGEGSDARADAAATTDRVLIHWESGGDLAATPTLDRPRSISEATERSAPRQVRTTSGGATIWDLGEPLGADAAAILAGLRATPGIASVEPDILLHAAESPNDPHAADLWGLAASDGVSFGIDALGAWPTTRGADVRVAVVDSGWIDHPDLAGRWLAGYDFIDVSLSVDGDGRDGDARDPGTSCPGRDSTWHGTHVAGTIAAIPDNGIGVFGGAPDVRIQPVRVLGLCGNGYLSDIADAIRWAAGGSVPGVPANATPSHVINLSLGGVTSCPTEMRDAIADARSHGALVVAAAGNETLDASTFTPANCPDVVVVAATDQAGQRASFSDFGATVDLAAPGVGIVSAIDVGPTGPEGPGYAFYSGTSMSTPHVSLTAALVRSMVPGISPRGLEVVLTRTATAFPADPSPDGCAARGCGAGIVDAGAAIARLGDPGPLPGALSRSTAYPLPGATFAITAHAVDRDGVASAEYRVGTGAWLPMTASDGAYDGVSEGLAATVTAPATPGTHGICIRATDPGANVSPESTCTSVLVDGTPPAVATPTLTPASASQETAVVVSSAVTDGDAVASAAVRVDGGPWLPMAASDGAFGGASEVATTSIGAGTLAVAADWHSCVLRTTADVWCWGTDSYGELGDGAAGHRAVPAPVTGLTGVRDVAVGLNHSCAVLQAGTVWCWGFNGYGQLGDGTGSDRASPVQVDGLSGMVAVAGGFNHTCALGGSGSVWCWGMNSAGQVAGVPEGVSYVEPVKVPGLADAVELSLADFSSCARSSDGRVRCWGENVAGAIGDGTTTNRSVPTLVSGITTATGLGGDGHPCALLVDATVRCWGYNAFGELGDGTSTDRLVPVKVAGLAGVKQIASGGNHTCALLLAGTVACWGLNDDHQLGRTTPTDSDPIPTTVPGLSGVATLDAGRYNTCAVLARASVRCWGVNLHGTLGDGTTEPRTSPVAVVGLTTLAPGAHQVCVRATDRAGRTSSGTACRGLAVTDGLPPWPMTFVPTTPSPTRAATITFRLDFDAPVTGLAAADFSNVGTAAGWVVTAVTGSGVGPYTVTATAAGATTGTLALTLGAGTVRDAAGNAGPPAPVTARSLVVDRTAPFVTLTRTPSGSVVDADTIIVTAQWSESVAGFDRSDVSAVNAGIGTFSGSGKIYTWIVVPGADGQVSTAVRAGAAADWLGNPSGAARSITFGVDRQAPVIGTPTVIVSGATIGTDSVPVRIDWVATDAGAGIGSQEFSQRRTPGATTVDVLGGTVRSVVRSLPIATTSHQFSIRATDGLGKRSGWRTGPTVTMAVIQDGAPSITYTGAWPSSAVAGSSGGTVRASAAAGASATVRVEGTHLAWVARSGPTGGRADVYVDGVRVRTVDLYAATTTTRRIVYQVGWSQRGAHTIRIVNLGTAGHAAVQLDAIVVLDARTRSTTER